MDDIQFADQNTAFEAQRQALARRRKLAEQLVAQGMQGNTGSGYQGGKVFIVGNPLGNIASSVAGNIFANQADKEQSTLEASQRQHEQTLMDAIANAPDPQAKQAAMLRAIQSAPSLREAIKMQMDMDKQEADRVEKGEQLAADRVEKEANAKAQREFLEQQGDLNRQNRLDLRQTPTIHISQSGGGAGKPDADLDRQIKEARLEQLKNPKPIASERKAALAQDDLVSRIDNALAELDRNPNAVGFRTIVPNIALNRMDPEGTAARAALGELSAEKAHEIYGASFTAAERTRADKFIPADGDDLHTVRTKLNNMKKLAEQARARAQGEKPKAPAAAKTVVREVQLKDGRTGVEYSDGSRGYK